MDKEGYVVRAADGGRLTPEEARRHGLAVEAMVRARAALGDEVTVIDEPMGKRDGPAFVNLRQVEADLERYVMWEARTGMEALFTLDGTRQEPAKEERRRFAKAKRAERQKEAESEIVNGTTRQGADGREKERHEQWAEDRRRAEEELVEATWRACEVSRRAEVEEEVVEGRTAEVLRDLAEGILGWMTESEPGAEEVGWNGEVMLLARTMVTVAEELDGGAAWEANLREAASGLTAARAAWREAKTNSAEQARGGRTEAAVENDAAVGLSEAGARDQLDMDIEAELEEAADGEREAPPEEMEEAESEEDFHMEDSAEGSHAGGEEDKPELPEQVAAWAAVSNEGEVLSGMLEEGWKDNYLAEFAAQLEVAARRGIRRVVIVFDATSPVEALLRYLRSCARKRRKMYRRDWFDAWVEALDKFEIVVLLWQTSHAGAVLNEWADKAADEATKGAERTPPLVAEARRRQPSYGSMELLDKEGELIVGGAREPGSARGSGA